MPPTFLQCWDDLEELHLSSNSLNSLIGGFTSNWKKLRNLDLRHNQIEWLPKGFSDLRLRLAFCVMAIFEGNPMLDRIKEAVVKIVESEAVRELYKNAAKHLKWQAVIEKPSGVFKALCSYTKALIQLNPDVSDAQLASTIIFELTNAANMDKVAQIELSALRGEIDCETFTKEIEKLEHQGILLHRKIVAEGIATLKWDPEMAIYEKTETDFERYWLIIKDTDHPGEYRRYWNEEIKPKIVIPKGEQ